MITTLLLVIFFLILGALVSAAFLGYVLIAAVIETYTTITENGGEKK